MGGASGEQLYHCRHWPWLLWPWPPGEQATNHLVQPHSSGIKGTCTWMTSAIGRAQGKDKGNLDKTLQNFYHTHRLWELWFTKLRVNSTERKHLKSDVPWLRTTWDNNGEIHKQTKPRKRANHSSRLFCHLPIKTGQQNSICFFIYKWLLMIKFWKPGNCLHKTFCSHCWLSQNLFCPDAGIGKGI